MLFYALIQGSIGLDAVIYINILAHSLQWYQERP